jgi:cyclopropane fatty-acyl-phospholipid synthase-like methyltransferase
VAMVLVQNLRPSTACDVGCGGGALVTALEHCGVDAVGLEGSVFAYQLLPDRIYVQDLRQLVQWDPEWSRKHDLVTCFDVAEHIEEEYVDVFVENLVRCTAPWGTLVLGPAPEDQDGLGHVNCQHPTYWIEKLEGKGFGLSSQLSNQLRREIKASDTNFLWWIGKNLMAFHRVGLSHKGRMWRDKDHWERCRPRDPIC